MKWHEIAIVSNPSARREAERVIMDELERNGFSEESCFSIKLAMEEAIVNAMKHGNNFDESKHVTLRYAFDGDKFHLCVRDEGNGFEMKEVPDPTEDGNLCLPYGRGIMLMKAYMDEICFNEQGNEVRMMRSNRERAVK